MAPNRTDAQAYPAADAANRPLVLVVDDDFGIRTTLNLMLRGRYRVVLAETGEEALALLQSGVPVDVAFLDVNLPGMSGLDVLRAVRERWPAVGVVVMTMFPTAALREEALRLGATAVIGKAFQMADLVARIEAARAAGGRA